MEVLTLEEAISTYKATAEQNRLDAAIFYDARNFETSKECIWAAEEYEQLVKWLKKLQRYEFEISECKAILDNPTPDVTENDKKRAMFVLQTFPDARGDEI